MSVRMMLCAMLIGTAACISSSPGVVRQSGDGPLITIGAGEAVIGGVGQAWRVWYVIDSRTRTCWMKLGDAGAQLDCCALRRVAEAERYITWRNAETCTDVEMRVLPPREGAAGPPRSPAS